MGDLYTKSNSIIIAMTIVILSLFFLAVYFALEIRQLNEISELKRKQIEFYSYEDVSTSIDEHNRLHILFYNQGGRTVILNDTLTLGIYSQISNVVYKDYIQKQK